MNALHDKLEPIVFNHMPLTSGCAQGSLLPAPSTPTTARDYQYVPRVRTYMITHVDNSYASKTSKDVSCVLPR